MTDDSRTSRHRPLAVWCGWEGCEDPPVPGEERFEHAGGFDFRWCAVHEVLWRAGERPARLVVPGNRYNFSYFPGTGELGSIRAGGAATEKDPA